MFRRSKTGAVIGVAVASAAHLQPSDGGTVGVHQSWFPLENSLPLKSPTARKRASSAKHNLAHVRRGAAVSALNSATTAYRRTGSALAQTFLGPFQHKSQAVRVVQTTTPAQRQRESVLHIPADRLPPEPAEGSSWISRCLLATAVPAPPPSIIRPVAPRPRWAMMSESPSGPPPRRSSRPDRQRAATR